MELNLANTKLRLIQSIMSINDDNTLLALERKLFEITNKSTEKGLNVDLAVKPIRSNVSLEEIDKEQNYSPVSYLEFRKDADKLDIEEPIEELLTMLTK